MKEIEDEELIELIIDTGELVYEQFWDSGAPGAGADSENIYEFEGKYYIGWSFDNPVGPFDSLLAVLDESELPRVSEATVYIHCNRLPSSEIARRADVAAKPGHEIEINGEQWIVTEENVLEQLKDEIN